MGPIAEAGAPNSSLYSNANSQVPALLKGVTLLDLVSLVLIILLAYLGLFIHSFIHSLLWHISHSFLSTTCLLSHF
jgi:hypothetical protein